MILFRDILKEALGKLAQESDYLDSDFRGVEDEPFVADSPKQDSEEEIAVKRPIKKSLE